MDLIIRNANLPDGRTGFDIGIKDAKIAAIEAALPSKANEEIDVSGYLASPP
ncbi:MAG: cytosine deaminase, partial [SAR324 cluster bacterium]|nr:cytosine deaminase [SAR324 cluster bacterium]